MIKRCHLLSSKLMSQYLTTLSYCWWKTAYSDINRKHQISDLQQIRLKNIHSWWRLLYNKFKDSNSPWGTGADTKIIAWTWRSEPESLTSPSPSPRSQVQAKSRIEKERKDLYSGLSLKSLPLPLPLPLLVASNRENTDESNMFKENIIKEMFQDSLW